MNLQVPLKLLVGLKHCMAYAAFIRLASLWQTECLRTCTAVRNVCCKPGTRAAVRPCESTCVAKNHRPLETSATYITDVTAWGGVYMHMLHKVDAWTNALSHTLHLNKRSFVWILECSLSCTLAVKHIPQTLHMWGLILSTVCVLWICRSTRGWT